MRFHFILALLFLFSTACADDGTNDSGPDGGVESTDAGAQPDAHDIDAQAMSPDASTEVSLVGTWGASIQTGPTYDSYLMTLTETSMTVERRKRDGYGEFINCLLVETWTGDWSVEGTTLTLTPTAGRTERTLDGTQAVDCDIADRYAERDMSAEEIAAHNYLSGEFDIENGRLDVLTPAGYPWTWRLQ